MYPELGPLQCRAAKYYIIIWALFTKCGGWKGKYWTEFPSEPIMLMFAVGQKLISKGNTTKQQQKNPSATHPHFQCLDIFAFLISILWFWTQIWKQDISRVLACFSQVLFLIPSECCKPRCHVYKTQHLDERGFFVYSRLHLIWFFHGSMPKWEKSRSAKQGTHKSCGICQLVWRVGCNKAPFLPACHPVM